MSCPCDNCTCLDSDDECQEGTVRIYRDGVDLYAEFPDGHKVKLIR